MERCTRNACLTPEENDCVELTCSTNNAIMKLYDLENMIERGELVFAQDLKSE